MKYPSHYCYSLTAPIVKPFMKYLWKNGYATIIGNVVIVTIAILVVSFGILAAAKTALVPNADALLDKKSIDDSNLISKYCNGIKELLSIYNIALNQSFQYPSVKNNAIVAIPGVDIGKTILKNVFHSEAPSILADSKIASGTVVLKNVLSIIILNELTHIGNIKANKLFFNPKNLVITK